MERKPTNRMTVHELTLELVTDGWSNVEIAEAIHTTPETVSRWRNNPDWMAQRWAHLALIAIADENRRNPKSEIVMLRKENQQLQNQVRMLGEKIQVLRERLAE